MRKSLREAVSHPDRGALGRQRSELANRHLPLRDLPKPLAESIGLQIPRGKEEVPDDDCQGPSRSPELRMPENCQEKARFRSLAVKAGCALSRWSSCHQVAPVRERLDSLIFRANMCQRPLPLETGHSQLSSCMEFPKRPQDWILRNSAHNTPKTAHSA